MPIQTVFSSVLVGKQSGLLRVSHQISDDRLRLSTQSSPAAAGSDDFSFLRLHCRQQSRKEQICFLFYMRCRARIDFVGAGARVWNIHACMQSGERWWRAANKIKIELPPGLGRRRRRRQRRRPERCSFRSVGLLAR